MISAESPHVRQATYVSSTACVLRTAQSQSTNLSRTLLTCRHQADAFIYGQFVCAHLGRGKTSSPMMKVLTRVLRFLVFAQIHACSFSKAGMQRTMLKARICLRKDVVCTVSSRRRRPIRSASCARVWKEPRAEIQWSKCLRSLMRNPRPNDSWT